MGWNFGEEYVFFPSCLVYLNFPRRRKSFTFDKRFRRLNNRSMTKLYIDVLGNSVPYNIRSWYHLIDAGFGSDERDILLSFAIWVAREYYSESENGQSLSLKSKTLHFSWTETSSSWALRHILLKVEEDWLTLKWWLIHHVWFNTCTIIPAGGLTRVLSIFLYRPKTTLSKSPKNSTPELNGAEHATYSRKQVSYTIHGFVNGITLQLASS